MDGKKQMSAEDDDLTGRLRTFRNHMSPIALYTLMDEAADRIEALTADRNEWKRHSDKATEWWRTENANCKASEARLADALEANGWDAAEAMEVRLARAEECIDRVREQMRLIREVGDTGGRLLAISKWLAAYDTAKEQH